MSVGSSVHVKNILKPESFRNEPRELLKGVPIPRGLINPNYPGFQKYAHTLAEYYVDCISSDYCGSDISDNKNVNNCCDYCYKQEIRSPLPQDIPDADIKSKITMSHDNGNVVSPTQNELMDKKLNNTSQPFSTSMLTDNRKELSPIPINGNSPDLLNHVGPCASVVSYPDLVYDQNDEHLLRLNLSPLEGDIIGDFGQEVERDFKLLVPGYTKLRNGDIKAVVQSKIYDAALSSASECLKSETSISDNENDNVAEKNNMCTRSNVIHNLEAPKYQKYSYDDRLLPPVVIDYKQCHNNQCSSKKVKTDKSLSDLHISDESRTTPSKKCNEINTKRRRKPGTSTNRVPEEISHYHEIVSNKEQIIRNSRYVKSCWAQYLEKPYNGSSSTSTTIAQFDAYKIEEDFEMEALKNHLEKAEEIEKKRRFDREETRKKLAMDFKNFNNGFLEREIVNTEDEAFSDIEEQSSDSETCPKLSKRTHRNQINGMNLIKKENENKYELEDVAKSPGMDDYYFFTKQSKLQIETRMGLAQSVEVARMKMKMEKQKPNISPIAEIIRSMLEKVGIYMDPQKKWISRQILSGINIDQLRILAKDLHMHIESLNAKLVYYLMERDDLQSSQDAILHDIQEINRYIVVREHNGSGIF